MNEWIVWLVIPGGIAVLAYLVGYRHGFETGKRVWRTTDLPPRTRYQGEPK